MTERLDVADAADLSDGIANEKINLEASSLHHDRDLKAKEECILSACRQNDLGALVDLAASSGGLLHDELRRLAWPLLLGASHTASSPGDWSSLPPYHDEEQVKKDVDRSFVNYPPTKSEKELGGLREDLSSVILAVLRRHPSLRYFQGYHDIVQVVLLVLGRDAAIPSTQRLSFLRIRDFMVGTDVSAAEPQLRIIPSIICSADRELYEHLKPTNPFYALASTLTLYAHTIDGYSDIARLFDFFLTQDATAPLYLFAAIILQRRKELLQLDPVEDVDIVTFTIQKLPPDLDLEALIERACELKRQHPPQTLPLRAWSHVSKHSVLKTTQDLESLRRMTLEEGEALFNMQSEEARRRQAWARLRKEANRFVRRSRVALWKHRRPAAFVVLSFAVGFLALALGRTHDSPLAAHFAFKDYTRNLWRRIAGSLPQRLL